MPIRIQRKRTKGWKMPENTVSVCRPGKWGNPFIVGRDGDARTCVWKYKKWLTLDYCEMAGRELAGKNLACWCKNDEPCHADVLLEVSNDLIT